MTPSEIADHLRAGDPRLRQQAAQQAMHLGADAAPAAAALAARTGDRDIGDWCIGALEKLGPPPADSVDQLAALLTGEELPAYWSATLIGRLGPAGVGAAKPLAGVAQSGAPLAVRERAVWALGKLGAGAAEALPTLRDLADDSHPRLARLAKQAISTIAGPQ